MERYICIHGHFYQPPRENAWLEFVELQDSAYPFHDWNERITAECYAPNGTSRILDGHGSIEKITNNYSRISFNFGPTLLAWLAEKEPHTYEAILAADKESLERFSGHGSAIAQAFNHTILPLSNSRDKYTQIYWGIRDFEFRFARKPEGMAKGLEDTAFYVHNPLVSVNEVGGHPNGPEIYFGVEEFHRRNLDRHTHWPHTMNASSTHDTKRSEDVRARINVLSELPDEWAKSLRRWKRMNPADTAPDANEQILIYQTLLGAWPIEPDRLKQYVTKALREGKTHSSWIDINEEYERGVLAFIDALYEHEAFRDDFARLHRKVAYFGALSSLSQLVLKIMSPGVPDIYRGMEMWDFSLSDPDNRRGVDFTSRVQLLADLQKRANPKSLLKTWADGRLKMYVIWKLLSFRRTHADLFSQGDYIPLRVEGDRSSHIIAFLRRLHDDCCLVVVPRLCASLTRAGSPPIGDAVWGNTRVELPSEVPSQWTNVLTGEDQEPGLIAEMLRTFPVGVLGQIHK